MDKLSPLARAVVYFGIAFIVIVILGRLFSGGGGKPGKGSSFAALGGGRVALLYAEGEITASDAPGGVFGPAGVVSSIQLVEDLYEIVEDDSVKAIVLRVNSPGGSAAASDEIYHAIRAVQQAGKPVVVSMGDVAASGGYYISAPADYIYANGATLTGSIGVIFQLLNFEELARKVGVDDVTLHAGEYKDLGNPFRPMKAEEKQMLTVLLKDVHDQFIKAVADGRKKKLTEAQVRKLATGQIWTGAGAVKAGLVDEVGDLRMAEAKARTLARLPADAEVVEYGDSTFFDLMFGAESRVRGTGVESLLRRQSQSLLQQLSGTLFLNSTLRDLVLR